MKILVGSPVRQSSSILKEFLLGLEEADYAKNEVTYFFVDDNTETASSELLKVFAEKPRRLRHATGMSPRAAFRVH